MQSPALVYLRIKLSKEMSGPSEMGMGGKEMLMGGKPGMGMGGEEMLMGGKPGMGMLMGGKPGMGGKEMFMGEKPGMSMGGKPGMKEGKPGMSMKEEKMLRGGKPEKMPMGRGGKDMEITPKEIEEMSAAEQGPLSSRVANTLGLSGSMGAATDRARSLMNFM